MVWIKQFDVSVANYPREWKLFNEEKEENSLSPHKFKSALFCYEISFAKVHVTQAILHRNIS